jgi:hypothetical protein
MGGMGWPINVHSAPRMAGCIVLFIAPTIGPLPFSSRSALNGTLGAELHSVKFASKPRKVLSQFSHRSELMTEPNPRRSRCR